MNRIAKKLNRAVRGERGATLIETVVALAILGAIGVAFLMGLATTSKANIITDEQTTAESIAKSQMEWIKEVNYVHGIDKYSPPMPSGDEYVSYSSVDSALPLHLPDDGIQKITITIKHLDKEVLTIESYKVNR